MVDEEFENIYKQMRQDRNIRVYHSGVTKPSGMSFTDDLQINHDELNYHNDPMTKLKKWKNEKGLRLIDVFQRFDKHRRGSVAHKEFIKGVKVRIAREFIYLLHNSIH